MRLRLKTMERCESNLNGKGQSVRREGDRVDISGDYQYRAINQGNAIQRFWHFSKILAIDTLLPPCTDDTVLDVGCGSGVISHFLGATAEKVIGIDANPDAVKFAQQMYAKSNVHFQVGLADQLNEQEASFTKIYCLELIEHIYEFQFKSMLGCFSRLLKPGGKVFLTTPNYRSMWPLIEFLMDCLKLVPTMADHQHVTKYNRYKLRNLCVAGGFSMQNIRTMCFAAPWIAPFSWQAAKKLAKAEFSLSLIPGSILICVLSKEEGR